MIDNNQLLLMKGIGKAYPGVQALDGITMDILPGEIHALVGENGAGKSTLMRILSGATTLDSGLILWKGEVVKIDNPSDAQALGISMIHQELAVIPYLDAAKNIFLGREPTGLLPGLINWPKLYLQADELLERLGLDFDSRTPVNMLTIAQQQMVEVVKALSMRASLIVMDEPTSSLTEREVEALFEQMMKLRDQGVSIIFISHRLEEVFRVADRLTVLRDGEIVGTRSVAGLDQDEVVSMMVGREVAREVQEQQKDISEKIILETKDLHDRDKVRGVSIQLRKGEILGVAGLVGAGRTAFAELIFGARIPTEGQIIFNGQEIDLKKTTQAIKLGMGFVPEDRKAQGLFLNMALKQNVVIASLEELTRFGFVQEKIADNITHDLIERLDIRTSGPNQRAGTLSGGNQQKVVISRWLALEPDLLILDEPTRGIDVGAKVEIHALLRKMSYQGVSILMISSELPEILSVSDRVLVMREGKIVAEFDPAEIIQDEIMHAAAGVKNE